MRKKKLSIKLLLITVFSSLSFGAMETKSIFIMKNGIIFQNACEQGYSQKESISPENCNENIFKMKFEHLENIMSSEIADLEKASVYKETTLERNIQAAENKLFNFSSELQGYKKQLTLLQGKKEKLKKNRRSFNRAEYRNKLKEIESDESTCAVKIESSSITESKLRDELASLIKKRGQEKLELERYKKSVKQLVSNLENNIEIFTSEEGSHILGVLTSSIKTYKENVRLRTYTCGLTGSSSEAKRDCELVYPGSFSIRVFDSLSQMKKTGNGITFKNVLSRLQSKHIRKAAEANGNLIELLERYCSNMYRKYIQTDHPELEKFYTRFKVSQQVYVLQSVKLLEILENRGRKAVHCDVITTEQ